MTSNETSSTIRRKHWVGLFLILSLVFITAGLLFYRFEVQRIRNDRYLDIRTVAEFKANQISRWRAERLTDVTVSSKTPMLVRVAQNWTRTSDTDGLKRDFRARMNLERAYGDYSDILLVSLKGRILFSLEPRPTLSDATRRAVKESLLRRGAVLGELYRTEYKGIFIDTVAPVMSEQAEPVAILIYRMNANVYLYPLITAWPGRSPSAETSLVCRDGDNVLFLNELRYRKESALSFRYSLSNTDSPSVQAVLGKQGMFLGKDYRGVAVVADLRPIRQSPWYMVAKVDAKEVLAAARYRSIGISSTVFLLLLLSGLVIAYAYRQRQAYLYKALFRYEQAERKSQELFRATLYSIGDAVITTDADGTVRQMNRVAERVTGWKEEEAHGRPIQEVFHIIDEKSRLDAENPVDRVLRVGAVVGLTNHTLLIAKDGAERPIADSGAPIMDGTGNVIGVVMVFRDQTEERHAEEALLESKARLDLALKSARMGVWHRDITENKLYLDDQTRALLGIDSSFTGSADEFYEAVHPSDRERLRMALELTVKKNLPYEPDHRVVWPDGSVHHVAARGQLVRDDAGRPVRVNGILWDITEQMKTEVALRESEAKFRSYIEASPLAMFVSSGEGRIVDVNRAATELLGYDAATLSGMHIWDIHPAKDREDVLADFATFSREGRIEAETRFQKSDGSHIWASLYAAQIGNGFSLAYCTDITNRKQAEEVSRRYELMSAQSRDIILFLAKEDGRILEANVAAERAYGYDGEELRKMTVSDLRAPEMRGLSESQMAEADKGGLLFETIHKRKDGTEFPVEVSSRGAAIGGRRTVISIVRDVTNRRRHQEEIEMLKHSIDGHYDGAYWIGSDNRFVYVNDAACRGLGYEREELIGMTVEAVNRESTPEVMNGIWQRLRKEGSVISECIHDRKDGSRFPVETVITYVQFGGREFACAFARDITEKKRLEEQLLHAQKMEAVGTLAGGVAHDFNNILTVIMGLANLVQMHIGPDDRNRPHIEQIVLSSEKAADLTRSLLAFSRKQKISVQPHRVGDVVVGTAKLLKRLLPEDIELKIETADNDAVAMLDVVQLDQVLMNLATNARDAMLHGGSLAIGTRAVSLDESFRKEHGFGRPGRYIRLSVVDTGVGMDERTMARIFDPFFTTKEVGKGTGLGLASVYGIVKQHEGYITVSSKLLKGTTFDIYLPLADAVDPRAAASDIQIKGGSETILVIEDDGDVRKTITSILATQGYKTLEAENGDEGLRVFGAHKADIGLIILDVVMPGKNGRQVLDAIKRIDPQANAIFVSGYTGEVILHKGVQEGVDFLQKPLSVPALLNKVREVLDR
jgi:two-component system, cell cycle sensor histidine kinase and response regulator CckA